MSQYLKENNRTKELLDEIRRINNCTSIVPYGSSRELLQDIVLSIYDLTSNVLDKYKEVNNE